MNRHSLILALPLLAASAAAGHASKDAAPARPTSIATGLFSIGVPERRADADAVSAAVAKRFGSARLVKTRRVLGRRGTDVVFVFEVPKDWRGVDPGWFARCLHRVCGPLQATGDEIRLKWAKAKPINLPIFEGDWNARSVTTQTYLTTTAALAAQTRATGRGQIVAVLDGGFDLRHEFLKGRLASTGYDALDDDDDPQDLGNGINDDAAMEPPDAQVVDRIVGHGTFVSSVILAVAPDAKILPVRVLDDEGWGTDVAVAAGITYAVQNGASVINMSLVLPDATQIVRDAVRAAVDAGVVIVSAAGTTDDGWQSDPYLSRRSICVGATDASDDVATWSQSGPSVQVFAPGVAVRGALGGAVPNSYGVWSGVSFAVPFLSAGAAMIRERHPADWTAQYVRDRLVSDVDPAFNPSGAAPMPRGRVDLGKSVPTN